LLLPGTALLLHDTSKCLVGVLDDFAVTQEQRSAGSCQLLVLMSRQVTTDESPMVTWH
jgi:hypothetical protein